MFCQQFLFQSSYILAITEYQEPLKEEDFLNRCKHQLFLLLMGGRLWLHYDQENENCHHEIGLDKSIKVSDKQTTSDFLIATYACKSDTFR